MYVGGNFSQFTLNNGAGDIPFTATNFAAVHARFSTPLQTNYGIVLPAVTATASGPDAIYVAAGTLVLAVETTKDWSAQVRGSVNAIAVAGSAVYLGGEFTSMKDSLRGRLGAVTSRAPGNIME